MPEQEIKALQRAQDDYNKRFFDYQQANDKRVKAVEDRHEEMMKLLQPISDVFNNVNGFGNVSIQILKFLALLGAGIGVLIALIKWLKS